MPTNEAPERSLRIGQPSNAEQSQPPPRSRQLEFNCEREERHRLAEKTWQSLFRRYAVLYNEQEDIHEPELYKADMVVLLNKMRDMDYAMEREETTAESLHEVITVARQRAEETARREEEHRERMRRIEQIIREEEGHYADQMPPLISTTEYRRQTEQASTSTDPITGNEQPSTVANTSAEPMDCTSAASSAVGSTSSAHAMDYSEQSDVENNSHNTGMSLYHVQVAPKIVEVPSPMPESSKKSLSPSATDRAGEAITKARHLNVVKRLISQLPTTEPTATSVR